MLRPQHYENIEYLAIGHITRDITEQGVRIGGSVAYAALTAQAFGLRAGIVTAWGEELGQDELEAIAVLNIGAEESTTFENQYFEGLRRQQLHSLAPPLEFHSIPEAWRNAPIVHLAPVLGEVSPRLAPTFKDSTLGITPQGWLREWKPDGSVGPSEWPEANFVLRQAEAVVLSLEDLTGDESQIEAMAANCNILVVTEAQKGAQLYSQGNIHSIRAPRVEELDPTGAGDIFAAAFFIRLHFGDDPMHAANVATQVAARSVEREGLAGVPTRDEIYELITEAL